VDRFRCYELWQLAGRPIAGDVLEIGVWRGGTGCLMAKKLKSVAPDRTVFCCDTFAGVVGVTDKDPSYSDGEHADTSQQIVTALAAHMNLKNVRILKGNFRRRRELLFRNGNSVWSTLTSMFISPPRTASNGRFLAYRSEARLCLMTTASSAAVASLKWSTSLITAANQSL
jgi:hypothetical protein